MSLDENLSTSSALGLLWMKTMVQIEAMRRKKPETAFLSRLFVASRSEYSLEQTPIYGYFDLNYFFTDSDLSCHTNPPTLVKNRGSQL